MTASYYSLGETRREAETGVGSQEKEEKAAKNIEKVEKTD